MKEMMKDKMIEIHVDDYALSENVSKDIRDLIKLGKVDGISVIPNFECFDRCMSKLGPLALAKGPENLHISVHLNLMEGLHCAEKNKVLDLIDANETMKMTWGDLLKVSFHPKKYHIIKNQIKEEFRAQIRLVQTSIPQNYPLRIDSHQHTHVIPVAWSALKEVIEEERLMVEYIRIPIEPLHIYLNHPSLFRTYSLLNIIKNILLTIFGVQMIRWVKSHDAHYSCLWGVVMSGKMDQERVNKLFTNFTDYAKKKKLPLEVLFHAGTIRLDEISKAYSKVGFCNFHLSKDRRMEWDTICGIHRIEDEENKENNNEDIII